MITREEVLNLLHGESRDVLPWTMAFFNELLAEELLGKDAIYSDVLPSDEFVHGATPRSQWEVKARYAYRAGMSAVPVGWGAGLGFGHGGPGEFKEKSIYITQQQRVTVYETGVSKEIRYNPHFFHYDKHPLTKPEDFSMEMLPDPDNLERYSGLADEIAYHKAHNRMTFANLNGFFSSIHYFIYPYEDFLTDLLLKPAAMKKVIDGLGSFNLRLARHILEAGVDILCFCDDLGSENSLLISPEIYRSYFLPWHSNLAALCREHNAYLHMHSHGNINMIINDICDAGIHILNPLDPNEGMDIAMLAEKYGNRITFAGGLDKFFFSWDTATQRQYLQDLNLRMKHGFFLMDSGGIPENITPQAWKQFVQMRHEMRKGRR